MSPTPKFRRGDEAPEHITPQKYRYHHYINSLTIVKLLMYNEKQSLFTLYLLAFSISMAISREILIMLTSYSGGYKIMRRRMQGLPGIPRSQMKLVIKKSGTSLSVTLSRLKKNGLVVREGRLWSITERGKKFLDNHPLSIAIPYHKKRKSQEKNREKNMVIAFDIPEVHRRKRNWLRVELVNLGFTKIQKSFWFGPAPLPKDFIDSLHTLDLLSYLKFFNANEKEIV
jgi:hypothetical protein